MRKQPPLLKDVADPPPVCGQADAPIDVQQYLTMDGDAALLRAQQTGNGVDDGCLPGTGVAEQRCDSTRRAEIHVQAELPKRMTEADVEAHGRSLIVRRSSGRCGWKRIRKSTVRPSK